MSFFPAEQSFVVHTRHPQRLHSLAFLSTIVEFLLDVISEKALMVEI